MAFDREKALASATAGVGAIEDRIVLRVQMWRPFHRHGAANMDIRGLDLALAEAEGGEEIECRGGEVVGGSAEIVAAKVSAERPLVEDELEVEGRRQRLLDVGDGFLGEALGYQGGVIDARRLRQRAVADGVSLDLGDVSFAIAERTQCFRDRAVDNLEVTAACELLELHQR